MQFHRHFSLIFPVEIDRPLQPAQPAPESPRDFGISSFTHKVLLPYYIELVTVISSKKELDPLVSASDDLWSVFAFGL
jgi:hypothetical protein